MYCSIACCTVCGILSPTVCCCVPISSAERLLAAVRVQYLFYTVLYIYIYTVLCTVYIFFTVGIQYIPGTASAEFGDFAFSTAGTKRTFFTAVRIPGTASSAVLNLVTSLFLRPVQSEHFLLYR